MDLTNKSELIHFLKSNGLYTKKSLGQNFLIDRDVLDTIIETANLSKDDTIVEVGPGLGTLTFELSKYCKEVIAVELDEKLAKLLKKQDTRDNNQTNSNIQIINQDILDIEPKKLTANSYKLIANIPYYITSKILRHFLESEHRPKLIVMMTQKEVAERICAKPRSTSSGQAGQMSLLAVSVQAYGEPEIIKIVKSGSFFPAPDVDSAILRIASITRQSGEVSPKGRKNKEFSIQGCDEKEFFKVVKTGFASRRKTLLNNLTSGTEFSKEEIAGIIEKSKLNANVRAQELSILEWGTLCQKLQNLRKS